MRTTCDNQEYNFCKVNKTPLRQTGQGFEMQCPVCGWKSKPTYEEEKAMDKAIKDSQPSNKVGTPGFHNRRVP